MAYLIQQDNTPYWTAQWTAANGKKKKRSTRVRVKPDYRKDGFRETPSQARAQQIADAYERADSGNVTAQKIHATINALLHSGGVPSVRAYLHGYLDTRAAQRPKTIANIRRAANSFLSYQGKDATCPWTPSPRQE